MVKQKQRSRKPLTEKASKTKGRYVRHDALYRKAKDSGYLARSIFKLEEIDKKYKLIKSGDIVMDLGAAPGSWLQYVTQKVGTKGKALGIDLLEIKLKPSLNLITLLGDIYETPPEQLLEAMSQAPMSIDVLLSDMAPNTTGIKSVDQDRSMALCEQALEVAKGVVKEKGHFCVKVLEGGGLATYVKLCSEVFSQVKIFRPKGTRVASSETYVIGLLKKTL